MRPGLEQDLTDIGVPRSQLPKVTDNFEACFVDRATAKDFGALPESCRAGEAALARNESSDPQSIAAIRASLQKRGQGADQRDFTRAMERTLRGRSGPLSSSSS